MLGGHTTYLPALYESSGFLKGPKGWLPQPARRSPDDALVHDWTAKAARRGALDRTPQRGSTLSLGSPAVARRGCPC